MSMILHDILSYFRTCSITYMRAVLKLADLVANFKKLADKDFRDIFKIFYKNHFNSSRSQFCQKNTTQKVYPIETFLFVVLIEKKTNFN